jgi:hypothetical protein
MPVEVKFRYARYFKTKRLFDFPLSLPPTKNK